VLGSNPEPLTSRQALYNWATPPTPLFLKISDSIYISGHSGAGSVLLVLVLLVAWWWSRIKMSPCGTVFNTGRCINWPAHNNEQASSYPGYTSECCPLICCRVALVLPGFWLRFDRIYSLWIFSTSSQHPAQSKALLLSTLPPTT
jgi:hypothetical protein